MLTLGFTNHYYTLWNVVTSIRYGRGEVVNGVFNGERWQVTSYNYIQNLSMDFDAAVEKITTIAGDNKWEEDLSLRGEHGSFERTKRMIESMADWQFTFGKLTSCDIRVSTDVWQLTRAMNEEVGGRRRAYARRRLLELGELVRYEWVEKVFDQQLCDQYWKDHGGVITNENNPTHSMFVVDKKRNYATPRQVARFEAQKAERELSGHFFKDGERVTINIKQIDSFHFETAYGTTFICKYLTSDNKAVKYMGANPPDISTEHFVLVQATAKHSEYKGVAETKLQRIKIK